MAKMGLILIYEALIYLMILFCAAAQVSVSPQRFKEAGPVTVTAAIGSDVILPCVSKDEIDVRDLIIDWTKEGKDIYIFRDKKSSFHHNDYKDRTSVFTEELQNNNMSLKLSGVKQMDEGQYCCCYYYGDKRTCTNVTLTVKASVLNCSIKALTVWPGGDVILPCHLQPPLSVESMRVEWTRPDLEPGFIHVHQDGRFLYDLQNPNYTYRTSLFVDQLLNGNVSLKLSRVTLSDAGRYRCFLLSLQQEAFVQLSVGSEVIGSDQPVAAVVGADVILPCHLEPPVDVTRLTVEWKYNREVVHVYKSKKDNPDAQNDQFKGRTALFDDEMHTGNISLKLTKVTLTDAGNYTCFVPKLQSQVKKGNVELIVDSKDEDRNVGPSKATVPTGLIAGLTIFAVVILIGGLVWWRRRGNQQQNQNQPQNPENPENVLLEKYCI